MSESSALDTLYREAAAAHLQPLWVETHRFVPRQPAPPNVLAQWKASAVSDLLQVAGEHMPVEHADRRVFVCTNPNLPPFSGTTQTLYACVQLLLPGEKAPPHRHTQSAFRLILKGSGAQTILTGAPVTMNEGDFVITPAWTWHGHANPGNESVLWLDGLDNAVMRLFDATFFELPPPDLRHEGLDERSTRQWVYPLASMRSALEHRRATTPADPVHGWRVRYIDPQTGRDPLPTMSAFISLLPAGFRGAPYRSTDSTVYVPLEGHGELICSGERMPWGPHDILAVPTWQAHQLNCDSESLVFSFSDRAAQERLECWREERLAGDIKSAGTSGTSGTSGTTGVSDATGTAGTTGNADDSDNAGSAGGSAT